MENIKDIILNQILKKGIIKVSDIVLITGFSRVYVQRIFASMVRDGVIKKIGSTKKSVYVIGNSNIVSNICVKTLVNKDLKEDVILSDIEDFLKLKNRLNENSFKIFQFAFSEMLNNAIEHSKSDKINIKVGFKDDSIYFEINDSGIGIFYNIMDKFKLSRIDDAIDLLLKGKNTTDKKNHSGQGIFFTSKIADIFKIYADKKKIIFDNIISDVFLTDNTNRRGTKIYFEELINSSKNIGKIFNEYSDVDTFEFNKTEVPVRLYREGGVNSYISRTEARRILVGIDDFKILKLDFSGIEFIGQGFADEIFRVYLNNNPDKQIIYVNANENVEFMIKKAISERNK